MKKSLIVLGFAAVVGAVSIIVAANCGTNMPVANALVPAFQGLNTTPANVACKIWIYTGTAAPGAYYGTMSTAANNVCDFTDVTHMLEEGTSCGFAAGQYAVLTDWVNTGFSGCPTFPSNVVILAEDNTGKYAVISRSSTGPDFSNLDTVGTTSVTSYPTIQYITRTSAAGVSPAVFTVNLQGLPANGNGGYASGDTPPGAVITGYKVYYQNAASLPTAALPGAWTLCTNGAISGATTVSQANIQAPLPASGSNMYLMISMVFDSGFESAFAGYTTGGVFTAFGPTAAPLFANVTADPTNVSWTSGDESRVASYQAYWSPAINGTYRPLGQAVAAQGPGHSYSVNYRVIAPVYYVKIKASKTDGTVVWSNPIKVTRLAPRPLPGKPGLRK